MDAQEPKENKDNKRPRKHAMRRMTKKKLDHFLASICEAAGMTGKAPKKPSDSLMKKARLSCKGPCAAAEWKAHLDIPSGILCVSAAWSSNRQAEKHRDVTIAITYLDEKGKVNYTDMVFCDAEVRWLMETLWHAPIW
jgi:hypothetical protein